MNKLENKVAIVTGASSGIGASIARLFAAEGAKLVLASRSFDKLQALAHALGPLRPGAQNRHNRPRPGSGDGPSLHGTIWPD